MIERNVKCCDISLSSINNEEFGNTAKIYIFVFARRAIIFRLNVTDWPNMTTSKITIPDWRLILGGFLNISGPLLPPQFSCFVLVLICAEVYFHLLFDIGVEGQTKISMNIYIYKNSNCTI